MKTSKQRAAALNVRGNLALAVALAVAAFLTASRAARGPWLPMHTWLVAALGTAAATALTCYLLAWLKVSPRGESPQVTHPPTDAPLTPAEVQK
ncbi:hypothetical protein AB0C44_07785 [Micromonospora taraxaci]|uniref:hypothetical protein n=1 Tax=Micromonospora taraxaci TaxID=1316803 RepID=UPI0033C67FA0